MKKRFMLSAAGASVAAIAGFASADITVDVDSVSLLGGEAAFYDLGLVSGTLTGISYVYAWANDTGDSSWSSDMLIGVSGGASVVSVGGYNMGFGGSSRSLVRGHTAWYPPDFLCRQWRLLVAVTASGMYSPFPARCSPFFYPSKMSE